MLVSNGGLFLIALVLALWTGAAIWALITGLQMRRAAGTARRQLRRLTRLIDSGPAIPLIVRSDSRIEGPERVARWLGLPKLPPYLAELSQEGKGLPRETLDLLGQKIATAQKSGAPFELAVAAAGSNRRLRIEGRLADPQTIAPGAVLLWFYDATESETRMASLVEAEAETRRAFDALSGLIEAAPIPMWFRREDLSLLLVNSAYVEAVGGSSAADVVQAGQELVETVDGLTPLAVAARAFESNTPSRRTVTTTIAGTRRAMEIVDLPIRGRGIAGYAIDVHDLILARQATERFRDAQRDMLDNLSAGVAQFDAQRRLIFVNQPFVRMFQLKPQWLQDGLEFERLIDRMREAGRVPQVRDFPAWRDEKREWFQSAAPVEDSWLIADGTHLRAIAQPTPDNGLLLIFEDRTEQVQLASARDTLLRVRTATFNNLYEALAVFTSDGRLHLWNTRFGAVWEIDESELAKHPRADELLKAIAPQLKRPAQISALREVIRSATLDRSQRAGQLVMKDGRVFDFVGIPLPDSSALFTMIDVSDAKRMEDALRERNEALVEADAIKTRFLANMSYEFRTPLTSIGGFAELLASGVAGPLSDQGQDYVKAIIDSVERLSAQINMVLDLSQSQAGTLPLKREPTDIGALLVDVAKGVAGLAGGRNIALEVDVNGGPGSAEVDRQRFAQAITAVVDNALRYTQEGGRVLLLGDRFRNKLRIVVSDNGPGLDARAQARALDGVLQADEAGGKPVTKRSGLGLPLAKNLIEAHGGRMELVSEPGAGTIVTILMP
ncbi:PAS/PAC sensor signal transduction histidine kinase [Blastomonas natatoria]|uniref:histidine kinase n=1 Tax=Blastomonas natatoria TaxID=34015 RepID=A0A2V3V4J0_9SPHN|nr:PAS domain-containing sensor histidine kinase [Blastomonas natatoria]PXW76024.1 PAS/PAC sensor signal transduction histidine kinase [Blastomonas natatoria]